MDQIVPDFLQTSLDDIQQTQRSLLFTKLERSEFKHLQPSNDFASVVRVGSHGHAERELPYNKEAAQEAARGADHCAIIYTVKEVTTALDKFINADGVDWAIRFIIEFKLMVKDAVRFYNYVRSLHQQQALEGDFYELRVRDLMNYLLYNPNNLFKTQVHNFDPALLLHDDAVKREAEQLYINCLPMDKLAQAGLGLDYNSVHVVVKDLAERDAQKLKEFERQRQYYEARQELMGGGQPGPSPVVPGPVIGENISSSSGKAPAAKTAKANLHVDFAAIGPVVACSGFVLSYVNIMHPFIRLPDEPWTLWFVLLSALVIEIGFTAVFMFVLGRNRAKVRATSGDSVPAQVTTFNRPLKMRSLRFTLIELVVTVAIVMVVLSFIYKQFTGPVQIIAVVVGLLVIVGAVLAYFLLRQPVPHVIPTAPPPAAIPVYPLVIDNQRPARVNSPVSGNVNPVEPTLPLQGPNYLPTIPVNPPDPAGNNGPVAGYPNPSGPVQPNWVANYLPTDAPNPPAPPAPVVQPPPVVPPVPQGRSFRLLVEEGLTPGSQVLNLPGPEAVITVGIRERNSSALYFWNENAPEQVWTFPGLDAASLEGVSRVHAHFRLVDNLLYLCSGSADGNQGARNGTFLNGEKLEHGPAQGRPVKPHDLIGLGPRASGVNKAYNRAGGVTLSFEPL